MSPRAAVLIDTRPSGFDVRGVVMAEGDGRLITAASHHARANTSRLSLGSCRESEESYANEAGDEGRDEHVTLQRHPHCPRLRGNPRKKVRDVVLRAFKVRHVW